MEENKNESEGSHHHGHHLNHEGGCCGLAGCCSGSGSKMVRIFLKIIIAFIIFSIGLSVGSHLGRNRQSNNFYGPRFNRENFSGARGCGFGDGREIFPLDNAGTVNLSPVIKATSSNPATPALTPVPLK